MLDSHVDGYNVAGASESPAGGEVLPSNVPQVKPNVQIQKPDVERCTASILQESFEMDYSLPDLPLKPLMTQMDIMGRLREQGEVGDWLGFKSSSHLESGTKLSEDDACPVPYFIPELEMYCARAEAASLKELTLTPIEEENELENVEVLETEETCPSQIEDISVPEIKESNVVEVEEAQVHGPEVKEALSLNLEDLNPTQLEEPNAPEMEGPTGEDNAPEELVKVPVIEEPSSPATISQELIQMEEPMAMPERGIGFISSLIGIKPIWRPSVRLCFGDRERRRTQSEEEMKQQTSKALKNLILHINLFKKFKEVIQEKSKTRGTMTYSAQFKQKEFQPIVARLNRQGELPANALAGGEPFQRNPVMHPERIRVLYKLDAGDGWARNSQDSDSSDSSDSDDSGIKTTLTGYSHEIMKIKHPIADRQDIESSGRILFSKPVTLFRFNSVKQWQREGTLPGHNRDSYTGDIKILERHGLYYILLREKNSSFLLVYTRIDGSWHIGYMANRTNSCGWFNFNYAFCPEGTPEHFACTFQEPSHAAEFVARVRNLVIKARILNFPR